MAAILVVDDEPTILNLCQSILHLGGHTVLAARGAEEALRLTRGASIELALLDIIMPGMNGIQLAHRLRSANPAVPIILMTGYSLREVQEITGENNPFRIIWKPFKTESLLRMIENALEGQPGDATPSASRQ